MPNYRIGSSIVDASLNCLRRDGVEHHLRHKAFQTLLYLIERRDRVVTKDELFLTVWKDAAVMRSGRAFAPSCLRAFESSGRRVVVLKPVSVVERQQRIFW